MRNFNPQTEHFDNFDDLVDAASTIYTLPFKEACKALKCSRTWAQKYIRPHVPCIYLKNGKGTGGANYAKIVSEKVRKKSGNTDGYSNESVYLDEKAFENFVISCIETCEKRSKRAYRSSFIADEKLTDYFTQAALLGMQNGKAEELHSLYLNYVADPRIKYILHPAIVTERKRTEAEYIPVSLPDAQINEWMAVHDLMDYGDIEESIHRRLFAEGAIKITLSMPDQDGNKSTGKKVYYISDPSPVERKHIQITPVIENLIDYGVPKEEANKLLDYLISYHDTILIKESAWIEYKNNKE